MMCWATQMVTVRTGGGKSTKKNQEGSRGRNVKQNQDDPEPFV